MLDEKKYRVILYPLLFFNVFFLSALLSAQFFLRGETVVVPEVVGKTFSQAKQELGQKKLALSLAGQQFDGLREKGTIISQSPAAGSRLKIQQAVKVVISRGSEQIVVPRFLNRSLEAVVPGLKEAGLTKGNVSFTHTPAYPAGRIIAQSPPPQSQVQRDTPLHFLVSQGDQEEEYVMPDLLGRQADAVRRKLTAQGFNVSFSGSSYYPGLEPGTIIRQLPPKGHALKKRTMISVEVSK
jgi:serine/threonine-protein kinase